MSTVLGTATIKWNGKVLTCEQGNSKLQLGGKKGTTRLSETGVVGASHTHMQSKLTVNILVTPSEDLEGFRKGVEAQVDFIGDNGVAYVISRAWVTELGEISTGESGNLPVTFEGVPAQKVGA